MPMQLRAAKHKRPRRPLVHLAGRVFGKVIAILPSKMDEIMTVLGPRMGFGPEVLPLLAQYDDDWEREDQDEDKDNFDERSGVQTINVMGTLVHRASGLDPMSGMTSYEKLTGQIQRAAQNPQCRALMLVCDSPGGEVDGCLELSDLIHNLDLPTCAVVDSCACSAGYAIASACDQVYVSRTAMTGSVGVFMLHCDQSQADKQAGLRYEYVFAGDHKVSGNQHSPLDGYARSEMQAEVTRVRNLFAATVARNRGCSIGEVLGTQAAVKYGHQSIPLFADAVGGCDDGMCFLGAGTVDLPEGNQPGDRQGPFARRLPQAPMRMLPAGGQLRLSAGSSGKGAIPAHHTATTDQPWSASENEARLRDGEGPSYLRKMYAYQKNETGEHKDDFLFPHHMVSASGEIGSANSKACESAIGSLNGARGGSSIPDSERAATYAHLAAHLRDAGLEPPELQDASALSSLLHIEDRFGGITSYTSFDIQRLVGRERGGSLTQAAQRKLSMLTTLQALKVRFPQAIAVQRTYKRGASVSSNRTINLLCAPYNGAAANLGGGLFEAYGPSCFRDGLTQNDLRVLHNHSETQSQVLGRVSAGTCRFWDAADGVHAIVPDPPNTTWCNDLIESMRRKEVTDSSAAFWIVEQHFEARNGNRTRVIDRAIMHDASCEAWGAYGAAAPATVSSGANFDMSTPAGRLRARISLQEMRLKSCQSWEESEIRRKIIDLMRERVS